MRLIKKENKKKKANDLRIIMKKERENGNINWI